MTEHDTGAGHPESPDRLRVLLEMFDREGLTYTPCRAATNDELRLAHPQWYIDSVEENVPAHGLTPIDGGDTILSPNSWEAALHAAGAVCQAVDDLYNDQCRRAFCAIRPPGHHAEKNKAMGFCLFANVFIGARHAIAQGHAKKVAIIDFDVHHGNGTDHMARKDENVFYGSTHEWPQFPGTGAPDESGVPDHIVNMPLRSGSGSAEFRAAYENTILPALDKFAPDLLIISAGFDAHRDDPLAGLNLTEDDFDWVTGELIKLTDLHCGGRVISVLEGGYNLDALSSCVRSHIKILQS
jgi:acetoin utilization deacetylase AcuC-like enzyme